MIFSYCSRQYFRTKHIGFDFKKPLFLTKCHSILNNLQKRCPNFRRDGMEILTWLTMQITVSKSSIKMFGSSIQIFIVRAKTRVDLTELRPKLLSNRKLWTQHMTIGRLRSSLHQKKWSATGFYWIKKIESPEKTRFVPHFLYGRMYGLSTQSNNILHKTYLQIKLKSADWRKQQWKPCYYLTQSALHIHSFICCLYCRTNLCFS